MKTIQRMLAASAAVLFGFVLYACGGSSSTAGGTITQAQFDQMLQASTLFTALQNQVPAVFIKAPNMKAYAARTMTMRRTYAVGATSPQPQLTGTCTGIGTLTGRPNSSDPISSGILSGVSCTGYYFDISEAADSTQNGVIQKLPTSVVIMFDGAGCTGNMYIPENYTVGGQPPAGIGIFANGMVFRYDHRTSGQALPAPTTCSRQVRQASRT